MSVSLNWVGAAQNTSGSWNSITANVPSAEAIAAGDLLIVNMQCEYDATVSPPDATWTLIRKDNDGSKYQSAVYYKIATSADVGATGYMFTATAGASGTYNLGYIFADFGGVDQATPIDTNAGTTGTSTAPSVSLATTNADVLVIATMAVTWVYGEAQTNPTGWTLVSADPNAVGDMISLLQPSAATVTAAWSLNKSAEPWLAQAFGINPAASTGGATVTISASGASASGGSAVASAIRRAIAQGNSSSSALAGAGAQRRGATTLTSDASVAGVVAVIRSAVGSIASSTANAASLSVRRAIVASSTSVSAIAAAASTVGSAILVAATTVAYTAMSAAVSVRRGLSVGSDAISGISARGTLRRIGAALSAAISAVHAVAQATGSMSVVSSTITMDMALSDTLVIDAELSDGVQLSMPLEEV